MNLIYYYPSRVSASSTVAKGLLKCLLKQKKELPFDKIKLFTSTKNLEEVQEQFGDSEIITFKTLNRESEDSLIHIPVSSLIFPNSKFFLHLFAIFKRRKLLLQEHGDTRTEMRFKWKYMHHRLITVIPTYIFLPYLLKSSDKLIVNSYLLSNLVRSKYGVKNDVVIPNAIDGFWLDDTNVTNIKLDGNPNLFYHGRLSPEKGIDLLLKGFAGAIGKHLKAKLYIAGDGPQREYLKKLGMKLGIEKNVVFLGQINKNYIKSYLNTVDAAIYPSTWDNFPLSFMEAFSSGNVPVYFSKMTGIYDFVVRDRYDLNAFEPTVENISKIIKEVIEGKHNMRVVKQQKDFARRYTWDKVIDLYLKVYNDFTL